MTKAFVPLAIPGISDAEAVLGNRLYGASGRVRIEIAGKRFHVSFLPAFRSPYRPALRLVLTIGDRPAALDLESVPLPELLGYPEGGLDPRDIPPGVLRAYLEGLLGGLRERAGLRLGRPVSLAEAGPWKGEPGGAPAAKVLHLELNCEEVPSGGPSEPVRARLHMAGEDFAALAEALPAARSGLEDWACRPQLPLLPLAIGFRIGSASLTAVECAALGIGDIILLAGDPMAKGGIRLCAGDRNRPLWKATWYAGQVVIDELCEEDMTMENEAKGGEPGSGAQGGQPGSEAQGGEPGSGAQGGQPGSEAQGGQPGRLDGLEVQLSFDLGGRMATLGEVRGLAAGSILALPENPDARVCIRVSGKAIGTGSLIMVDGRAGVRVESLKDGGNP